MKTIVLSRDLGIKKARKLYNAAVKVMDMGTDCAVDFSRVRHIDLSIAQVVLALKRECSRKGGMLIRSTSSR